MRSELLLEQLLLPRGETRHERGRHGFPADAAGFEQCADAVFSTAPVHVALVVGRCERASIRGDPPELRVEQQRPGAQVEVAGVGDDTVHVDDGGSHGQLENRFHSHSSDGAR